jgi:tetratricopeptide (TPR) repeat protein
MSASHPPRATSAGSAATTPVSRLRGLDRAAIQQVILTAEALERGHAEEAGRRIAPLLASHANHPEVLRLQAGILTQRGDHPRAALLMQRAIDQRPDDPLYYNTLGSILGAGSDLDGAIKALRHACSLQPNLAIAWYNLGVMFTHSVRHTEAIEALEQAVHLDPALSEARALLGDMLRTQGRMEEAAIQYRKIIAERPWAGMAWWGLADIKVTRFTDSDIAKMQQALHEPCAVDDDLVAMGFALARALDDHHRYQESLAALAQANAIMRRKKPWRADVFSANISGMLEAFSRSVEHAPDENLGSDVIFVVSLPRSGSTLVEQILASHSGVQGTGELPDLPLTLTEESRRRQVLFPLWAAQAGPEDWKRLGERYLERTSHWRSGKSMIVDKLPSNWMYLGAIRSALPGAKIIACYRDPLETCFSCYRQHLANNEYTRSFDDLAAFWRDYDRSIEFWRARAPNHVFKHVYEHLTGAPEISIRALLEFCNLPFEEACLRFHENEREVRSPSAMQVRQPLKYDTARTHEYGALLDPLRKALGYPPFTEESAATQG